MAHGRQGEHMLLFWCDRDRDFETPRRTSECQQDRVLPGCTDSALSRGADHPEVEIEDGRFMFLDLIFGLRGRFQTDS